MSQPMSEWSVAAGMCSPLGCSGPITEKRASSSPDSMRATCAMAGEGCVVDEMRGLARHSLRAVVLLPRRGAAEGGGAP